MNGNEVNEAFEILLEEIEAVANALNEECRESKQKRLKVFRLEPVLAGFKKAWQEREYATIIGVALKIPENVVQEDPKLLMWYDKALTRMGESA